MPEICKDNSGAMVPMFNQRPIPINWTIIRSQPIWKWTGTKTLNAGGSIRTPHSLGNYPAGAGEGRRLNPDRSS